MKKAPGSVAHGAAVGGIIGSAVGHPAAGVAIGGGLGLGAGALVGDPKGRRTRVTDRMKTSGGISWRSSGSAMS